MSPKPFRLAVIAGMLAAVAALGATALTGCSTKVSGGLLPTSARPSTHERARRAGPQQPVLLCLPRELVGQ
jgi:hypothetical protein